MSKAKSSPSGSPLVEAERLANSLSKALREALRSEVEGDAVAHESALRASTKLMEETPSLLPAIRELIPAASDRAERQYLELEAGLREQCATRGWRFDGQWPRFYVERAVSVECEPRQRSIRVADEKVSGSTAPSVMAALEPIVSTLLPKHFSGTSFLASLALSYDAVKGNTSQPPILEVYRDMIARSQDDKFWRDARPERFKGLSADQFRARIALILERGETSTADGRELRLLPPLEAGEGLFVYQPAEARFGFVGRIEFCPAERPEGR
jgi:hypothetical protein